MALPGIELSASVLVGTTSPVDSKYGPFDAVSYAAAISLANTEIIAGLRYKGLTVGLSENGGQIKEYWYRDGVADNQLIEKSSGGGGDIIVLNQTGPTGTPSQLAGAYEKFNFVNYDPNDLRVFAQEDPNDADQVNIFFPPPASPTYPPYFNQTGAIVADPIASLRKTLRISDPSTNGNFETGGWTGFERSAYLLSSATELQFKPGSNVYILGFSPAGAPAATGCKVQVKVYDADGVSILRDETTGVLDGNTTFTQNEIEVIVSNYTAIVDPYGDPTQYQAKLNIKIKIEDILNSSGLGGGRFSAEIIFTPDQVLPEPGTGNPGTPKAAITYDFIDVFADANPTSPDTSIVSFIDATPQSTQIYSYLSGVKYLTAGSEFGISSKSIQGINGNTQGKNGSASNNLSFSALLNMNTLGVSDKAWSPTNGTVIGWSDIWDKTGIQYDYTGFTIQSNSHTYRGEAGSSTLTISDPWNNATKNTADNLDVLILTPGGTNPSDLTEYFNNESRRLSKASLTANYATWNSQTALTSSEFGTKPSAPNNTDFQDACQIVDGFGNTGAELISANKFYLSNNVITTTFSGYLPTQTTDFSSFVRPSVYHRKFGAGASTGSPFASFSLTFTGSNWGTGNSNVNDALNNQDLKIYIRRVASNAGASSGASTAVPLNLHNWNSTPSNPNKYWSPGAFNDGGSGIDTHSATIRASTSSGNSVQATFGGYSADIGIFVEIQYLEPNIKINSITCALNF